MDKDTTIKSYKGFNRDMTCRGFQYEEGKTYTTDRAEVCKTGFHACKNPLDCFRYYSPANSVYHEVEQSGDLSRHDEDSKVASSGIRIGARLNVAGIIRASIEYVRARIAAAQDKKECGDGASLAGGYGASLAGGYGASLAGGYGASLAGGDGASLAGGDGASLAGGYRAVAACRGRASVGVFGAAIVRGHGVRAKGGLGAVLVLVEEDECRYDIRFHATVVIDGKLYRPDTWYGLGESGNVVEAKEDGDE